MTRGRKLSASSIREKVEKILGIDDNPYGLPPIYKDPNDSKLRCFHDPSRIPVIGKFLPRSKSKDGVARRRRSSSMPARYQAIYANTPADVEIKPEDLEDFDRREKAYYDYFPHLRPCMTIEEYNKDYDNWHAKYTIKHLKRKPLKYYPWELKYKSRELLNPRRAPKPPGYVERPISKALPPLPPHADSRSTCDTDYLISQFPPAPETIPSTTTPGGYKPKTTQKPTQRRRSGSEGTKITWRQWRDLDAVDLAIGLKFAPDIRSELCHCDDDTYAGQLSRPTEVHRLDEHEVLRPTSRGGVTTRPRQPAVRTTNNSNQPPIHVVNMFRAQERQPARATPPATAITMALEAQFTAWEEEIAARDDARAEALRKLENNQNSSQSTVSQVEAIRPERDLRREKDQQRHRLQSEPKRPHGPSSSTASGSQESRREESRQRQNSRPQPEDTAQIFKTQKDQPRERNQSEPKHHAPSPSTSLSVAQDTRRARQPDGKTRAGAEFRTQDDTSRRRNVRRSVSASNLYDMVQARSQVPSRDLHRQAVADASAAPPLPSTTPTTANISGTRAAATPAQGHAPTAIRPRPSRPNLGPPPSLSSGAAGLRSRAPSSNRHPEEKPATQLETRTPGVALNHKASNTSFSHRPVDKNAINPPVYIKSGDAAAHQLRYGRLQVQDLQVTMIPLSYYAQQPATSESATAKAGAKEQTRDASGTPASSRATTSRTQLRPKTPPPIQTTQFANHTIDDSPSSASSYGSSAPSSPGFTTSSNYGGYAASSTTTLAYYGYTQKRSYESFASRPPSRMKSYGALGAGSAESRSRKASLTPMHVPMPKTGALAGAGGAALNRPVRQANAVASSSRDAIDNISKVQTVPVDVDPDFEDEELIRGYKPRKFGDSKKLIQEERDRLYRERKDLPAVPFPVSAGHTAPLRIRKKASQLQM